jgi:MOSC domain-containing protein YiiM
MAYIEAICISEEKGIVKTPVDVAEFIVDYGITGDAHAGKWHRQVSLLMGESIDRMKLKLPEIVDGSFAENIITRDIDLGIIKIGDKLKIGNSILLEITQIGKKCHSQCKIGVTTGECIMPKEGLFAKVLMGGTAKSGDGIKLQDDS